MKVFKSKVYKLSGTSYSELFPKAFNIYKKITGKTKRRPFIRSKYFLGSKIFLDYFWQHLHQKNLGDKARRLKFYPCALDSKYENRSVFF